MSDDQVPQAPAPAPKSLQDRIGDWLKQTYDSNKILFFSVGLVVGLAFLALKYHNLLINILLGSSKELLQQEKEKDATLAAQADKTKAAGDALVTKAQNEPNNEKPVPDDWYKK